MCLRFLVFSFPCNLLKCVELKYSFASKRLKLAAKKYINKPHKPHSDYL